MQRQRRLLPLEVLRQLKRYAPADPKPQKELDLHMPFDPALFVNRGARMMKAWSHRRGHVFRLHPRKNTQPAPISTGRF